MDEQTSPVVIKCVKMVTSLIRRVFLGLFGVFFIKCIQWTPLGNICLQHSHSVHGVRVETVKSEFICVAPIHNSSPHEIYWTNLLKGRLCLTHTYSLLNYFCSMKACALYTIYLKNTGNNNSESLAVIKQWYFIITLKKMCVQQELQIRHNLPTSQFF